MSVSYFDYLCIITGKKETHGALLKHLYSIPFYALVPNDDNRGEDGKYLRSYYLDEIIYKPIKKSIPDGPCSVLEMMIGLAYRLEFETTMSRWERTPGEWFWILADNLGIAIYDNEEYLDDVTVDIVADKIDIMLSRHYERNGSGGLFPLRKTRRDQRRVELWYQMSAYLLENYPI